MLNKRNCFLMLLLVMVICLLANTQASDKQESRVVKLGEVGQGMWREDLYRYDEPWSGVSCYIVGNTGLYRSFTISCVKVK